MASPPKTRPGPMRLVDATQYPLPLAAWVSILHRVSGVLMFVLLPFVIWLFDVSLSSEVSYERFTSAFSYGLFGLPGVVVKWVVLLLIWALLHHVIAGLRHLWMDVTHSVSKAQGRNSALFTMVASLLLTALLGLKLFGLFNLAGGAA